MKKFKLIIYLLICQVAPYEDTRNNPITITIGSTLPLINITCIPLIVEEYENSSFINAIIKSIIQRKINKKIKINNDFIKQLHSSIQKDLDVIVQDFLSFHSKASTYKLLILEEQIFTYNILLAASKEDTIKKTKLDLNTIIKKIKKQKALITSHLASVLKHAEEALNTQLTTENTKNLQPKLLAYYAYLLTVSKYLKVLHYIYTSKPIKLIEKSIPETSLSRNQVEELSSLKNNLPKTIHDFENSTLLKKLINYTPIPSSNVDFSNKFKKNTNEHCGPALQKFLEKTRILSTKKTSSVNMAFLQYKFLLTILNILKYTGSEYIVNEQMLENQLINIISLFKEKQSKGVFIPKYIKEIIDEAFIIIQGKNTFSSKKNSLIYYIITLEIEFEYLVTTNYLKTQKKYYI